MSILCQYPGTARIRESGKLKEELMMFLLLKENGGWDVKKKAALLTNPLFPCRVHHYYTAVETERESLHLFWSACSFIPQRSEQDKQSEKQKEERHASSLVHTIKVHVGTRNSSIRESRLHCGGVCCNITADFHFFLSWLIYSQSHCWVG